jgi:hypothetical protein
MTLDANAGSAALVTTDSPSALPTECARVRSVDVAAESWMLAPATLTSTWLGR